MSQQIRMYTNKTTHERLVIGAQYSMKQLSMITKIAHGTLHNRFGYADVVTDADLRIPHRATIWPLLETKSDKLSASWLNKGLV